MKSRLLLLFVVICISAPAVAEPYWIAWEGDDFPENQGWERHWGNWDGPYEGEGAIRTLNDGVMTINSLEDDGIFDFSRIERPGQMDPGPGELFVMEWRLLVERVEGWADPVVAVSSDDGWNVGFEFKEGRFYSTLEGYAEIEIAPHVYHEYRLETADMRTYQLFIDDELVRTGDMIQTVSPSFIGWGDSIQGGAGLHDWDFFHFGVVPEPASLFLISLLVVHRVGRRSTS